MPQIILPGGIRMTGWDPVLLKVLTVAERRLVYNERWRSSASCPPQDEQDPVELFRRKFWPLKVNGEVRAGTIAKCYGCRLQRTHMPAGADVPMGMDDEDYLPCGCTFLSAVVEQLLVDNGHLPAPGNGPKSFPQAQSSMHIAFLEDLHGGLITVLDLLSANARRGRLTTAMTNGTVSL